MLRHPSCSKIPVEVGAPEPFEADKDEKDAVLKYTDTWLRTTSTERRECVSSLVGRALVTDSTPGSTSHAHFLAAMVADYVKEKSINFEPVFPGTPAHMGNPTGGDSTAHPEEEECEEAQMSIMKQKYWSANSEVEQSSLRSVQRAALANAKFKSVARVQRK